jgi:hypothetical protein
MTTEAIIAAILVWAVFIGGLSWCFSKWRGKGGRWEE